MAKQKPKTQAQKAAAAKNKISSSKKTASTPKKDSDKVEERKIPIRFITSSVFLGLFVLFLVIFLWPEGLLLEIIESIICGLIGRVGFVVAIPALLYMFLIHAFSGRRPVKMRTICLASFVFICGCVGHLVMNPGLDFGEFVKLYIGGAEGTTGGILCGCVSILLCGLCGPVIPYILLILGSAFALLGGMQITVPSIIRAVQNRPRAKWEEEVEERQEPAAIVVNHIANKRIAYIENQRQKAALTAEEDTTDKKRKRRDMLRQIDGDVQEPVAAAADPVEVVRQPDIIVPKSPISELSEEEKTMPVLELEPETVPAELPVPAEVKKEKVTARDAERSAAEVAMEIAQAEAEPQQVYYFPPIELLKRPVNNGADGTAEMRINSQRLNETLASFKIEAHIINVTRGPSVTLYEVELEKGVRLSKLTTAADDLALSLGATGVRIAAVPGKISVVGIEVPNKAVNTVSLREVIDSQEFHKAKSKSSFAVGKDIGGSAIVGNIAKLPHMLIAGTTGSGKSVCMNSIIISLLYKASPEDVKLIMVDPKMVELGIYNGIPHLLIPVVTDPKKAAGSLQWAVTEMMRRYKAMSDAGVRDLESYNSIMESQEEPGSKLPQVVVIIDELADLMLVAAKEVEESICRIAQMGRAAGIHLIIATQRPSADVITGLMKANIPSRIAFAVASAMESRIILDTQGAEKLVGKGDMLYAPIGNGKPKRVQGCFVSDAEVEAVANYVKSNYNTTYDQQVMEEIEQKAAQTGNKSAASDPEPTQDELAGDEMLPAAVDVILETGQASVSMLQRRLKLGYARAARIVDEMEERGIVGPFQGSKPRSILITKEQWEAMKSGQNSQMDFADLDVQEDTAVPEDF